MAEITGLGGIFYKVDDPKRTQAWYRDVLGLDGGWGVAFRWSGEPSADPYSLLSPFPAASDYFAPSEAGFMINLRVDDLEAFLDHLRGKGVEVLGTQDEEYGKFAWILDCDGVKIELWQQLGPAPQG